MKIKDLKNKEINFICRENKGNCWNCPLHRENLIFGKKYLALCHRKCRALIQTNLEIYKQMYDQAITDEEKEQVYNMIQWELDYKDSLEDKEFNYQFKVEE